MLFSKKKNAHTLKFSIDFREQYMFVKALRVTLIATIAFLSLSSLFIASYIHSSSDSGKNKRFIDNFVSFSSPTLSHVPIVTNVAVTTTTTTTTTTLTANDDDQQSDDVDTSSIDIEDHDSALWKHKEAMKRLQQLLHEKKSTLATVVHSETNTMKSNQLNNNYNNKQQQPQQQQPQQPQQSSVRSITDNYENNENKIPSKIKLSTAVGIKSTTPRRATVAAAKPDKGAFAFARSHRLFEHFILDRFEKKSSRIKPSKVYFNLLIIIFFIKLSKIKLKKKKKKKNYCIFFIYCLATNTTVSIVSR